MLRPYLRKIKGTKNKVEFEITESFKYSDSTYFLLEQRCMRNVKLLDIVNTDMLISKGKVLIIKASI